MSARADLWTAVDLPAVVNPPPLEFRPAFMAYLFHYGSATASFVRNEYSIPGNNDVGGAIRGMCREGLITADGYDTATGKSAKARLTRRWKLTDKGRDMLAESEGRNV
ncbi:MAG: hypothetical protein WCG32_04355 [Actinomycetes bacterium]